MDDNVESARVSGKSKSSSTQEVVNFHPESPLVSGNGVLDSGTVSKNSKRIRSLSSSRFTAKGRVSNESSIFDGGHENRVLKKSPNASVGSHAEGSGVSAIGNLGGLFNGAGILKKKRGFFKRRHANSSWASTGDCGIGDVRLGNAIKGNHRLWMRNVGTSSALKSDGDVRILRKRKEKSLSFLEPVFKKRKDGGRGGSFFVNFNGPSKKRSRVVGKRRSLSGSTDDLHNLDQLHDASKSVDVINLSIKKDDKDLALEKPHVEGGTAFSYGNHIVKPIDSPRPKIFSSSESSLQSKNHSRCSSDCLLITSNDGSSPLINSLFNKRQKISKRIDQSESSGLTLGISVTEAGCSSTTKKLKSKNSQRKSVSPKDGTPSEEVKPIVENSHKDSKEASTFGSVEHLSEPEISASAQSDHSLKVGQDSGPEAADRGGGSGKILSVDSKEQEVERCLKLVESSQASVGNLLSLDTDVPKVKKLPTDLEKHLNVGLDCLEDSSNLISYQTAEQENLEQNAAQMLSSRFNSSCNGFAGSHSPTVRHSANGSPFSRLFHQNFKNIGHSSLGKRNISSSDGDPRVLRPRNQKHKHFIKRQRRRFVEVRYRETDAYWVVNKRVKVFWPLDEQWYYGDIKGYNPESNLHYIQYDDRDEEWLSLGSERFKLLLCKGEIDHVACTPFETDASDGKHASVENCSSKMNGGTGVCLDSEPIISWLARSSSRTNSSSPAITKKQKKSCLSGKNLPKSVSPKDPIIDKKGKQSVSTVGVTERNEPVQNIPLQLNDILVDSGDGRDGVQYDSFSKKRKVSLVYFRRHLCRKREQFSDAMDQQPACEGSLGYGEGVELLSDCSSPASRRFLQNSCIQDLKQKLACFERLSGLKGNSVPHDTPVLLLEKGVMSVFPSALVNLDQLRLILSIPTLWAFDRRTRLGGFGFCSALVLLNFGSIFPVWPKVHLEIMMVNKWCAFRILLFEGCLGHAVALLFSVLSNIHTLEESRDPIFSVEFNSIGDLQLPFISISFRSVGDKGKETVFVFNFLKIQASSWDTIHVPHDGLSCHGETMPSAEPADSDVRFLGSQLLPVGLSSLERTRNEGFLHYADEVYRSFPGIFVGNCRSLAAIILSFSSAPTFFILLHLKLMMGSAIASFSLQNHFMLKAAYWSKQFLIKNEGGLSVELPSGVNSLPTAGLDRLVPKHSKIGSNHVLPLTVELPSGVNSLPTAGLDRLVPKHSKIGSNHVLPLTVAGDLLKSNQHIIESEVNAIGTYDGTTGARKDFIDDIHRRTVIRLRRFPCNMGTWQYAGRSRSSIVSPATAESDPTYAFSSPSTIKDQTASPSSQPALLPFERSLTTTKNPAGEMVRNSYDGYLWQQSTTAPRSMSNNSRLKSVRKSFSCHSKSWQEGRSRLLYNEFLGGSWRQQTLGSASLLSEDNGLYPPVNQENDDELPADLVDSACLPRYLDSLSCGANILVTVGDRGWRERGAQVMLSCHDQNDWRLLVKIQGSTRYTYKAHRFLQPGVTNRANHAIIWKGGKDWSLEFVNRGNYMLFKEMHEECYNRNIRAASVKTIPIPGVHLIEEDETGPLAVPFVHGPKYISQIQSDIEMALDPSCVLYDMDYEDQEWLMQFRKSFDIDEGQVVDVSDEMFERAMDMFEKVAYAQQCEEFSCDEIARFTSEVGPFDIMNAIYEYWRLKRIKKGMPLLRQLQPPLWEQYQRQLKVWELAVSKLRSSSNGSTSKGKLIEKPPMFAFCLRPRGLEMLNKGSKQRSQKKIPAVGSNNVSPRELESYHFNGRKINLSISGDERAVTSSYEYSDASPRFHARSMFSPRYASHAGSLSRNREWLDPYHSPRVQHANGRKVGVLVSSTGCAIPSLGKRNGVLHLQRPPSTKWLNNKHYQSDDSSMEQSSDQSGSTDLEEFRWRDPVSAAKRACALAKLKRLKAQRLLQKADLALHKAMVALVTAELIQAAQNDSKDSE